MFRLTFIVLVVAVALAQLTFAAIDISQYNSVRLEFQDGDAVQSTRLDYQPEERVQVFIGDLIVGRRYADETVYRRTIEFKNPTDTVQSTSIDVTVSDGNIHFISLRNTQGSYAVVCDKSNGLGGRKATFSLRVPSNSQATLTLTVATDNN